MFKPSIHCWNNEENQAHIIAENTTASQWDEIVQDLNIRVRQGRLKIDNSTAYLVGVLQNMGKLPRKSDS